SGAGIKLGNWVGIASFAILLFSAWVTNEGTSLTGSCEKVLFGVQPAPHNARAHRMLRNLMGISSKKYRPNNFTCNDHK
ncbi:MAG: hypothetical protein EBQ87_09765, partial [Planctomycetes bacterium]|nr:hypothetical protein [Planctomycetota bacterium]